MSLWGILFVIFAIGQFLLERYNKSKKDQLNNKSKKTKTIKNNNSNTSFKNFNKTELNNINSTLKEINTKNKKRKFIDREKEILSSNLIFSEETLVQDFIFSEILRKPKIRK